MASRFHQGEKEEETNGVKNPPRRQSRRNQWRQESTQKNIQQEIEEETARSKPNPDWYTEGIVFETLVDLHQ